ncbi:MAG: thiamine-phosphate synthase family protein [Candidatus Methanomethylicaceae archaeon]|nr:thiamine-phosphate synthase family protein [Candidatus Verstraetearchaeota archaeon]
MNPPCEITVRVLLPALRVLIAKELSETYGWTQTRIARKLGVTQAAVSGYLAQDEKEVILPPFSVEELSALAKSITSEINVKRLTYTDLINHICKICLSLRRGGTICHAHKMKIHELEEERCAICMQLHMSLADVSDLRRRILSELRLAVDTLESCQDFTLLLPEVFSNIVMALKEAKTISDVAGVPGRIVRFRGKAKSLMDPEFGVSGHLGKVLLTAMRVNPNIRSAMNIKYDADVMTVLNKLNLKYFTLKRDPAYKEGEDELIRFIEELAKRGEGWFDAIVDEGGFGIEPNVYLFEENASKLADRVVRIARMVGVLKKGGNHKKANILT